jgi:hypothetical protein
MFVAKKTLFRLCLTLGAFFAIFFLSLPTQIAHAETIEVSGPILTDTTWVAGNVYVVVGDVTVLPTVTLTIDPGTVVKFQNDRSLLVDGKLTAIGTSAQKIYFTYWADDTVGGDTNNDGSTTAPNPNDIDAIWGRVRFNDSSDDTSVMDNVIVRYGGNTGCCEVSTAAVEIVDASPTIQNSQISLNRLFGISLTTNVPSSPSTPILTNNTFSSNLSYALTSDLHSKPDLSGNILTDNGGNGMEIRGGTLQANHTWDQASVVHIVTGNITVAATRQLVVNPGVIVKIQNDRNLLVDGKLTAIGTSAQKIYFTHWADDTVGGDTNNDGTTTAPNPNNTGLIWGRIRFADSSDDTSVIEHAVIRYGGNIECCELNAAVVEIIDASPTIRNSQISQNRLNAISMESSVATIPASPVITNNTLSSNLSFALSSDLYSHPDLDGNTLINNAGNGMEIKGGTLQADQAWDQPSVVYVLTGDVTIPSGTDLTVAPGVVVKVQDDRSLLVNGKLSAVGTSSQKIVFTFWADDTIGGDTNNDGTATAPNPNDTVLVWGRIRFGDSSDDTSVIEHAIVRYAGNINCCDISTAAIEVVDASPTIRNTQISQNRRYGVSVETSIATNPSAPVLSNNTFSTNLSFAVSSDLYSHAQLTANTLVNNGGNGMEIKGGTLQVNQSWDQPSMVYVLTGDVTVAPATQLTIDPGVIIKLQDDRSLLVDGKLTAIGNEAQRIYFTYWADDTVGGDTNNDGGTTSPNPGNDGGVWGRIRFSNSSDDSSVMDYAIVRYAGNINCCEINVAALQIVDASPTIRNSQFTLNRIHGISTQTTVPSFPADPVLVCLDIERNSGNGLFNQSPSSPIDARNLWWGSITGPYHPTLNSRGRGDEVSNGVSFTPWSRERCTSNEPVDHVTYLPLVRK